MELNMYISLFVLHIYFLFHILSESEVSIFWYIAYTQHVYRLRRTE